VNPLKKTVSRLVIVHPKSVQFVQHDPATTELIIRYVSGEEMTIRDKEDPEAIRKMFDGLVFQIKDASD
jgi:predicted RNA-binding protein (virulence factor B family)